MTEPRGSPMRSLRLAIALFVAYGCGRSISSENESDASGSGGNAGSEVTPPTGGVESGGSGAASGGRGGTNPSAGNAGTSGSGARPSGGANAGGTPSGGSAGGGGASGAGGAKRTGELCVENDECESGYCYSNEPAGGVFPPRSCRDCLNESRYELWCDEDDDCCPELICGIGERAGLCITR